MDTVCLRAFDFPEEYVFRTHNEWGAVFNLMKFPKGDSALGRAFERAIIEVKAENTNWGLPVFYLIDELKKEGLLHHARSDICNEDDLQVVLALVSKNVSLPNEYYALHLCNEWLAANGVNKNSIPKSSTVGRLITLNRIRACLPLKLANILYQAIEKLRFVAR